MENKLKVKVNDEFDFEFTRKEIEGLDAHAVENERYHILENRQSYRGQLVKSDYLNQHYSVKINGNHYQVDIANELDLLIEDMGMELDSAQQVNEIKAPMPGLILEISAKEGQEVKEGDYILVLEAMKMENAITAPRDAVIKKITAKKGETVEKNQVLIELE
jgi:biotin carboxyl carrier protein